jgi:hypothetical protein
MTHANTLLTQCALNPYAMNLLFYPTSGGPGPPVIQERRMNLHLTESSAVLGMQTTAEAERAYWLSRRNDAVKAPEEIDVHAFHEALGLMYPLNWSTSENGEWETFMLQKWSAVT